MCHSIQCPSVLCCYKLHVYSILQVHCNFVLCNLWPPWFWCSSLVSLTKKEIRTFGILQTAMWQIWCLSTLRTFLYLFWSPLHLSCLYLSIIHEFAFLSLSFLPYFHPRDPPLPTSLLAAAESALILICRHCSACALSCLLSPLSLHCTSHQVATHSSISDSLKLWHHTTLHKPSISVQVNLTAAMTLD